MQSYKSGKECNFKMHIVVSDSSVKLKTKYQRRQKSICKINSNKQKKRKKLQILN